MRWGVYPGTRLIIEKGGVHIGLMRNSGQRGDTFITGIVYHGLQSIASFRGKSCTWVLVLNIANIITCTAHGYLKEGQKFVTLTIIMVPLLKSE